ncbi:MAG: hypothetical protein WCI23_12535, partial [Chlorobiaceae bacterium]
FLVSFWPLYYGIISYEALINVLKFKSAWHALGTLDPDRLSALRLVATIESIGSLDWHYNGLGVEGI